MGMFDTRSKIYKEIKRLFVEKQFDLDFLQAGVPQDILIKKLAKRSYEELKLEDFNKEYPRYGVLIDELIEKRDLWRTGVNRVMLPQKGKTAPMVSPPPQKSAEPKHAVLDTQKEKPAAAPAQPKVVPAQNPPVSKKKEKQSGPSVLTVLGILITMCAIGIAIGVLLHRSGF